MKKNVGLEALFNYNVLDASKWYFAEVKDASLIDNGYLAKSYRYHILIKKPTENDNKKFLIKMLERKIEDFEILHAKVWELYKH